LPSRGNVLSGPLLIARLCAGERVLSSERTSLSQTAASGSRRRRPRGAFFCDGSADPVRHKRKEKIEHKVSAKIARQLRREPRRELAWKFLTSIKGSRPLLAEELCRRQAAPRRTARAIHGWLRSADPARPPRGAIAGAPATRPPAVAARGFWRHPRQSSRNAWPTNG
jgi:hypothetical protein